MGKLVCCKGEEEKIIFKQTVTKIEKEEKQIGVKEDLSKS